MSQKRHIKYNILQVKEKERKNEWRLNMTYVCSDLHGYPPEKFEKFTTQAGVTDKDTLYILGDVIDRRGDGGVEMLRRIISRKNVKMIMGNHERMLLDCSGVFDESRSMKLDGILALNEYLLNGGAVTIENLRKLKNDNPREFADIMALTPSASTGSWPATT